MTDTQAHKHCWHYITGWSDGLGAAGEDTFRCCHCDRLEVRPWKSKPDPGHGPFCRENVKAYQ